MAYKRFYETRQQDVGHYFRSLYNLVKFVDMSSTPDKRLYTNLVRAQLSTYELALLCYNCLSSFGAEKFKPFVEDYALLKGLSVDALIEADHKNL